MTPEEKAKFSERLLNDILKELKVRGIRVHQSSDFSMDGYSIMLSIFIPFPKDYLLNDKIMRDLTRIMNE